MSRRPIVSPKDVGDYIRGFKHDVIDLTRLKFEKPMVFDPALLRVDKPIMFNDSEFANCQFWQLKLHNDVSFVGCKFINSVFENVSTDVVRGRGNCNRIDFTLAEFRGDTIPFQSCSVYTREEISFDSAKFESLATPFKECHLESQKVTFADAIFQSDRFYVKVAIRDVEMIDHRCLSIDAPNIDFARMKVNGHFEYGNFEDAGDTAPLVSFLGTDFRQMRTATLRDANLKKTLFLGSLLENVLFVNPSWPHFVKSGRVKVYDDSPDEDLKTTIPSGEDLPDSSEFVKAFGSKKDRQRTKLNQLLELYIALKKNYEASGNLIGAGDWHYREMECRRQHLAIKSDHIWWRWLRQHVLAFTPWYKYISEYGENYWRPFASLMGVLLLGGFSYFYSGYGVTEHTINYDFAWPVTVDSFWGFTDAMLYSLGVMSFQLTKTGFQHGTLTSAITLAQVLLTLILVPLFLLALRRKFRR